MARGGLGAAPVRGLPLPLPEPAGYSRQVIDRSAIAAAAPWATAQDLEALAQGISEAGRDWPDVEVPLEPFLAHVRERWEAAPDAGRSAARVKDLFLAFACALGDPAALRRFDVLVLGQAAAALRRMRKGDDFVDEALQRAREHLLVGGEKGPRIAGYGGAGSLTGWARVVAVRVALQMARERGAADEEIDQESPDPAPPDLVALRVRALYGEWLKLAIEDALRTLDPADREILALLFKESLTMSEVGERLGVNKSTISRRVSTIRSVVFDKLQRRARDELRLQGTEYASLLGQLRSQLDITLGVLGPR